MSLITVDLRDRKQLCDQITDNIKMLIATGDYSKDDKLPSVRSLAGELGINPNTIQKAYSELEREGIILTLPGRGSIILADASDMRREKTSELENKLTVMAAELKTAGIKAEEFVTAAQNAAKSVWKEGEQN